MISLLLLLVVSHADKVCPQGQDDQADVGNTCAACADGTFKAQTDTNDLCIAYATATKANCTDQKRTLTAGTSKIADDSSCAEACDAGFSTAPGTTGAALKTLTCKDNCAAGFGGATCQPCTAGTDFNDGSNVLAACTGVAVCDAAAKTGVFAQIDGTATTNVVCGCAGGQWGAACAGKCAEGKFLAPGAKGSLETDCATWKVCKGTATASAKNDADADEWGTKTAGTAGADAVCNDAKPAAPASSAAVLAIPAFLIALLF